MTHRVKMTVEMDVTVPQALTLQAMFKYWNTLASIGSSRMVAFCVDGDGNFKPKCAVTFSEQIPELTPELEDLAVAVKEDEYGTRKYDFDAIAWKING